VAWSPDGRRLAAASDDRTIIVWSDLDPPHGIDDPRLWSVSTYCPPLEARRQMLGFPEDQSSADLARCRRGVARALLPPR
jgi:hypothetical protein